MKRICFTVILFIAAVFGTVYARADLPPHDGYLVKLKPSVSLMSQAETDDDIIKIDSLNDIAKFIDKSQIEYIEPNYYVDLFSITDDPDYFTKQWNMQMVNAPNVWETGCVGQNVKIAVIDSGVDAVEDLKANLLPGYSFVDEDTSNTSDISGHGTFVSGIIAAEANNKLLVAGLAYRAKIVPLKCFKIGETGKPTGTVDDVSKALRKAVDDFDCKVINLSLGIPADSQTLKDAVEYALGKNAIVVAACGNETDGTVNYPSAYDGVISVGSVDSDKKWRTNRNQYIDIGAPGHGVYGLNRAGSVAMGSGSSYAAPVVSALAAVCLNFREDIKASEFETLIKETGEEHTESGGFSYKIVNAQAMIRKILEGQEIFVSPYDNCDESSGVRVYNNTASPMTVFEFTDGESGKSIKKLVLPLECGEYINTSVGENEKITTYIWGTNLRPLFKREK